MKHSFARLCLSSQPVQHSMPDGEREYALIDYRNMMKVGVSSHVGYQSRVTVVRLAR